MPKRHFNNQLVTIGICVIGLVVIIWMLTHSGSKNNDQGGDQGGDQNSNRNKDNKNGGGGGSGGGNGNGNGGGGGGQDCFFSDIEKCKNSNLADVDFVRCSKLELNLEDTVENMGTKGSICADLYGIDSDNVCFKEYKKLYDDKCHGRSYNPINDNPNPVNSNCLTNCPFPTADDPNYTKIYNCVKNIVASDRSYFEGDNPLLNCKNNFEQGRYGPACLDNGFATAVCQNVVTSGGPPKKRN
jgi:hypothetical protein